ncbi:hypothetical protein I9W82_003260 [Candida metapsilosis]|uniref:LSM12 anticodon-binding domain-containing protein n=1 Tax=Candida metapsilosis TaxID=273372 RepID=A0A8H7ZI22_9ASCO|nr:hypothetical protein I9W82_003260 [Candida metapsilosis]
MPADFTNLYQALALKLKITTLLDQEIVGFIYTFSSSNEVLVLITSINQTNDNHNSSPSSSSSASSPPPIPPLDQTNTYRIINTSFIKSIQVLNPPTSRATRSNKMDIPLIAPINVEDLDQFLQEQIEKYKPSPVEVIPKSTNDLALQHSKDTTSTTQSSQQSSPTQSHHHHHHHNHHQQHRHQSNQKSISTQLHEKLSTWFGSENVTYGNQKHTEIIIHNDIKLIKPFTNTQKNIQVLNKQTKHLPALTRALKQFWDGIDSEKKGG